MPAVLLSEMELTSLHGLPHLAVVLYLSLRKRMDLRSGIVGAPHLVSWQALREDTYEEYRPGQRSSAGSRWTLLRAAHWLERVGLVEMRSSSAQRQLVFFLPQARLLSFAQNQTAPIPHTIPHGVSNRENPQNPAHGVPGNPAHHRGSVLPTPAPSIRSPKRSTAAHPAPKLSFPQSYTQEDRAALIEVTRKNRLSAEVAQLLMDELIHREKRAPVRSRAAMFAALCKQHAAGTFKGKGAEVTRSGGRPLSEEETEMLNEGGMRYA